MQYYDLKYYARFWRTPYICIIYVCSDCQYSPFIIPATIYWRDLINSQWLDHSLRVEQSRHQLVDWHRCNQQDTQRKQCFFLVVQFSFLLRSTLSFFSFLVFPEDKRAYGFFRLIWTYLYCDLKWSKYRCKKQRCLVIKVSWSRTNRRKSEVPEEKQESGETERT